MSRPVRVAVPAAASAMFMAFGWWLAWRLLAAPDGNFWGYFFISPLAAIGFACAAVSAAWEMQP